MSIRPSSRAFIVAAVALAATVCWALVPLAQRGPAAPRWPGKESPSVTLLPNGWRIAPAGRHRQIGDLPLNMVLSPDGRFVIVTNNGWTKPTLTIFDTRRDYIVDRLPLDHAWLGLAWHPDGSRLYSSGAADNTIGEFAWGGGKLKPVRTIRLGPPQREPRYNQVENAGFVSGLAISPDGSRLFATQVFGLALVVVDVASGTVARTIPLPAEPYSCVLSPDGKTLFVSLWGGAKVLAFDAASLEPAGDYGVGEHPNDMAFSKDGRRLFVACASTNAVWVVDLEARVAKEQVSVALYPNAPVGTTPNSLAISADGETLLVANADNNALAVVDIAKPGASEVEGFIPVGWYPTDVAWARDGKSLLVLSGKGLTSMPNPRGPQVGSRGAEGQFVAGMSQGALSIIDVPTKEQLASMTRTVHELTPYSDARKLAPGTDIGASPIPRTVGDPSPIKHVFYVIRENRTYDQVFGDISKGNGDPNLTLFGEEVTPNAHALVNDFVLFDNFYVDAEVSYDGHAFSTGAYATDVVEKLWPNNYGRRGGPYLSEGGWIPRTPYGNFSAPPQGYLWDFATRAGVSVRSYGEFATWSQKFGPVRASVPGLEGRVHPSYPPYDLTIPDNKRIDIWLEEFRQFEANGQLPRLSILRLGNDHTAGTQPGMPTPRAMVAENDVALGRLVEAISNSRFWKESAIFVLEDDAQNGSDHVDAHRSLLLAISPFSRRGALDSTLYTTSGVLRTIELILGLPPMSQYDAGATPMYAAFQPAPDLRPFKVREARISLNEVNDWNSPGAQASLDMNLRDADMAPELELNEIIWKSVRGKDSAMPPPVRSAFIRPMDEDDGRENEAGERPASTGPGEPPSRR